MDIKTEFSDDHTDLPSSTSIKSEIKSEFKSDYSRTDIKSESRTVIFSNLSPPSPSSPLPDPSHSPSDPDILILDLSPADRDIEDQPTRSVRDRLGPLPAKRPALERLGSRK